MASFLSSTTRRQRQREVLNMALYPDRLTKVQEEKLCNNIHLHTLCLIMRTESGGKEETDTDCPMDGHSRVAALMEGNQHLPALTKFKLAALPPKTDTPRKHWDESHWYVGLEVAPTSIMRALETRCTNGGHMKSINFSHVVLPAESITSLLENASVGGLILSAITTDYDQVLRFLENRGGEVGLSNYGGHAFSLSKYIEKVEFHRVEPRFIAFVCAGITKHHAVKISVEACEDQPLFNRTFNTEIWHAVRDGAGDHRGIVALTFENNPLFGKNNSVFSDLMDGTWANLVELNLERPIFSGAGFTRFTKYLGWKKGSLRKLGLKGWRKVEGTYISDSLADMLSAIGRGPVVWYAHTHIECEVAAKIAHKVHLMGLQAVHLEIHAPLKSEGERYPAGELVEAARLSNTLGVFDEARKLEIRHSGKDGMVGLSAIGISLCNPNKDEYEPIFSNNQMDALERFMARNRKAAEEVPLEVEKESSGEDSDSGYDGSHPEHYMSADASPRTNARLTAQWHLENYYGLDDRD